MVYPKEYRYTKDHEWIDLKGGLGTIGLTDYAQCQMGDVVFVELPAVGTMLEAEKPLGTVESVKTVNEIYSPVTGEVVEVNTALKDAPEKINSDPHGAGWLIKVLPKNLVEISGLMDAETYQAHLKPPPEGAAH
jgi:glycine cleavage system H protein